MSEETQEEGCGEDLRAGWRAEDLFCGGPLVFDERIQADVQAAVADLQERQCGQRLADLLALVRPPDSVFEGVYVRQDTWNLGGDPKIVALVSEGDKIGLLLAQYGIQDYAEILKRFSDPEFRAAHNLEKRPDFSDVTRESPPAEHGAVEALRRAEASARDPDETWRRFRDSALRSMVKRELAEEIVSVEEWDDATRVVIQIPVCDPLSWGDPEPDIMAVTRDIARS